LSGAGVGAGLLSADQLQYEDLCIAEVAVPQLDASFVSSGAPSHSQALVPGVAGADLVPGTTHEQGHDKQPDGGGTLIQRQ
jgi:hypothetical protein